MSLARAWRRQLLEASGMAVLAPAATIVALALLALAGGFAHLSGLGQAFNGPTLPSSPARAGASIGSATHARQVGSRLSGLGATLLLASTTGTGGSPAAGSGPAGASPPAGGSGSRGPGGGHFTGGPQPVPGGTGGSPPPPSNPPPNPPPHQTLVDGVVKVGTSVTSKLPGPVGPAATQALQTVGQTVDKVLPAPPAAAPSVLSGRLSGSLHLP